MNLETQLTLTRLLHHCARYLDDHKYNAFLQLFADEGEYSISCIAPELPEKMIWMQRTRHELGERIKAMDEHEWEIARIDQTRIISVDTMSVAENSASTSTSFSLYHTDQDGRSKLFAVGRYEDQWECSVDSWLLTKREVALKTRLLDMLSPLPI
ncbi:MAG: nuclear transport factor 2 family protein [Gammaproteobacteria bacterium]|nr:nuclear transport factor 2 family protein [Gammaproteobacteria bacterium]